MHDPRAARLPEPAALEQRAIALAMLDAVLSPEWEYRYHSFDRRWDPSARSRMGSMRDGSGDDYFILFFADGSAAIKGLAHESAALGAEGRVAGVLDEIPESFTPFTEEAAFGMDAISFARWHHEGRWRQSPSLPASTLASDGSTELLHLLVAGPEEYASWAADYFETPVDPTVVARFFQLEPLTPDLARALREDAELDELHEDLEEIGYPTV